MSDTERNRISLFNPPAKTRLISNLVFQPATSSHCVCFRFLCPSFPPPPPVLSSHWLLSVHLPVNLAELSSLLVSWLCSDGLVGPAACACQLRLLTSDPGYSPRLLLRILLQGDCHLPRTLLDHTRKPGGGGMSVCYDESVL